MFARQEPYDLELSPIEPHYRFYYDCLMRPNARSVLTALRCGGSHVWPASYQPSMHDFTSHHRVHCSVVSGRVQLLLPAHGGLPSILVPKACQC